MAVTAPDTNAELRNWIKDNATLLSNATLLISIAALALNLLPGTGFVEPYIQGLLFGGAFLLLIELHHQWPGELQLQMFRRTPIPDNHSWRMTGFAFVLQLATVLFAVWAVLSNPLILFPLTAIAIVVGFRRWYFRRFGISAVGKAIGIVSLIAVLIISELLMMVTWAVVTGEPISIEFFVDERTSFELTRR